MKNLSCVQLAFYLLSRNSFRYCLGAYESSLNLDPPPFQTSWRRPCKLPRKSWDCDNAPTNSELKEVSVILLFISQTLFFTNMGKQALYDTAIIVTQHALVGTANIFH